MNGPKVSSDGDVVKGMIYLCHLHNHLWSKLDEYCCAILNTLNSVRYDVTIS